MATAGEKDNEKFMRHAIVKTKDGIRRGQAPFGACVVKDGQIVSCVHNVVWQTRDVTAHAEVHAIRETCRKLKTIDLSGCVIYSTCEPCPMCFSAIHWAGMHKIVYGAGIRDAQEAGFSELPIPDREMNRYEKSPVKIVGGVLKEECRELFKTWRKRKNRRVY